MHRLVSLTAFALLAVTPSFAATHHRAHRHKGVPNWDAYAGYSYVFKSPDASKGGMTGWDASLKMPIFGALLGIKGDVSGFNSKSGPNLNTRNMFFLLGPQVGIHISTSTIWLHGLIGSAHLSNSAIPNLSSDNTFAVAVGGGLDAGMSRHLAWRVTCDFYNTHYSATSNNVGEVRNSTARFSTGPIFRF